MKVKFPWFSEIRNLRKNKNNLKILLFTGLFLFTSLSMGFFFNHIDNNLTTSNQLNIFNVKETNNDINNCKINGETFESNDNKFSVNKNNKNLAEIEFIGEKSLLNPQVSPNMGGISTLFNFTVWYFDNNNNNNLPIYVNITFNNTSTYSMVQVNPLDIYANNGILYYFNTTFDFGNYKFQINCSDGLFVNSTEWIIGPKVNPFYLAGITVFEDDFERGTLSPYWTVSGLGSGGVSTHTSNSGIYSAYHCGGTGNITSLPIDLSIHKTLYVSYWVRRGSPYFSEWPDLNEDFIVEYYNNLGVWVELDKFLGRGTIGEIFEITHILPSDALHSNFKIKFTQTDATGEIFDYWHFDDVKIYSTKCVNLLLPSDESSFSINNHTFKWQNFNSVFFLVNYTFQISNKSDFSCIVYEQKNIVETLTITNITILVDFDFNLYYWRVCPTCWQFKGDWSEIFAFNLIDIKSNQDDIHFSRYSEFSEKKDEQSDESLNMFVLIIVNLVVIGSISVLTSGSVYVRKKIETREYSRKIEYEKNEQPNVIPALINEKSEIKCIICFQNDCPSCGLNIREEVLEEIKSSITNLLSETEMSTPELRAYFKLSSSKIWKLMRELEKAQKVRRSGKKGRAIVWNAEICRIKCPHCEQIYHKHCWEKTIRTISVCSFCLRNPSS